jgi:hypothetical protein
MKKRNKYFLGFFLVLAVALGSIGTLTFQNLSLNKDDTELKNIESLQQIVNECDGLNLENTAICLTKEIGMIYNYKSLEERDQTKNKDRAFEDIKENGGNCYDYTFLYMELADMLEINNYYIKQTGIEGVVTPHRYFIMWNESNYCTIDQIKCECYPIK